MDHSPAIRVLKEELEAREENRAIRLASVERLKEMEAAELEHIADHDATILALNAAIKALEG